MGSPERLRHLIEIINPLEPQIIVLSAVAGTTNALVEISNKYLEGEKKAAEELTGLLYEKYKRFVLDLFKGSEGLKKGTDLIDYHFDFIASFSNDIFTPIEEKIVLSQGELLSTSLFHFYLSEIGVNSALLPALDFMKIDENNEPVIDRITQILPPLISRHPDTSLFITQGYICRNAFGEIDNLRRGGSDFTASLIGAGIHATEIQIWTDIDGMHNNDPRIVKDTKPIAQLSFDEAAELAYFGAKILHPQSVFPAQKYGIPVRLLNTLDPVAPGTLITHSSDKGVIKSVAAKDNITSIIIHSSRMLLAYGFLRKVFEVFERYKTPIDMITTSEVAVSVTIDDVRYLSEIASDLEHFGAVQIEKEQTIVCVVGDFSHSTHGFTSRVFDSLKHLTVKMISYGASDYSVSLLIDSRDKTEALRSLHNRLF